MQVPCSSVTSAILTYFDTYVLGELIKIHLRLLLTVEMRSTGSLAAVRASKSVSTLHEFWLCSLVLGLKLLIKFFKPFKALKHFKVRSIGFRVRVRKIFQGTLAGCEAAEILLLAHVAASVCLRAFSGHGRRHMVLLNSRNIGCRVSTSERVCLAVVLLVFYRRRERGNRRLKLVLVRVVVLLLVHVAVGHGASSRRGTGAHKAT